MPSALSPHNFFVDDFSDNSTSSRWQLLQVNGATVNETSQRLQVTVPNGSGWAQAGYVTVDNYALNEHIVSVNVPSRGNLNEMTLQICKTITNTDPSSQNDWYRIQKTGEDSFRIQRRINGASPEILYTFTSTSQELRIRIQDGVIYFSDGDTDRYMEYYNQSSIGYQSPNCYVYLFTSSQRNSAYGTGAFDNFRISPIIRQLNATPQDIHDFNCSPNAGGRGVTIWGPVDLPSPIASNGGLSPDLLFTPTKPKCYGSKDFCLLTYTIHTSGTNPVVGFINIKGLVRITGTPPIPDTWETLQRRLLSK